MKKLLFLLMLLPVFCFAQTNITPQFKRNIPVDSLLGYSIPGVTGNHWLPDTAWVKKHAGSSGSFIKNTTVLQTGANFRIDGIGRASNFTADSSFYLGITSKQAWDGSYRVFNMPGDVGFRGQTGGQDFVIFNNAYAPTTSFTSWLLSHNGRAAIYDLGNNSGSHDFYVSNWGAAGSLANLIQVAHLDSAGLKLPVVGIGSPGDTSLVIENGRVMKAVIGSAHFVDGSGLTAVGDSTFNLNGPLTSDATISLSGHGFTMFGTDGDGNSYALAATPNLGLIYVNPSGNGAIIGVENRSGNLSSNFGLINADSTHFVGLITQLGTAGTKVYDQTDGIGIKADSLSVDTSKMSGWVYPTMNKVAGYVAAHGGGGATPNALTVNNSGTGTASPFTFDGSAAKTISYNSIGAQAQLSGTGFVKATGTSISYDNSTYLTTASAASTYQTLANLETTLTNSTTLYPSGSAVETYVAGNPNHYVDSLNNGLTKISGHIGQLGGTLLSSTSVDATNVQLTLKGENSTYKWQIGGISAGSSSTPSITLFAEKTSTSEGGGLSLNNGAAILSYSNASTKAQTLNIGGTIVFSDAINARGPQNSANYDGNFLGTSLTDKRYVDSTAKAKADSVKGTISPGTGTVTSIATSTGILGGTITTTGTLKADTTVLQTVLNFFPKGDTRYLKISSAPTGANPSALITFTLVNGSSTNFIRADGAPKADSTVIRSVANSYSLSGMQTKLNNYALTSSLPVSGNPSGLLTFTAANGSNTTYERTDGLHAIDSTVVRSVANSLTLAQEQTALNLKANIASPTFTGTVTIPNGGVFGTPTSMTATNVTGLPLSTGVTGLLPVANGGSGVGTITGLIKGNGTSNYSAATAGTDYNIPIVFTTTGVSGAATYNSGTGALNIPNYAVFTNPLTTLGDLPYGGASGALTRLAGNTTVARAFLTETESGGTAVAPTFFDLFGTTNTFSAAQTFSNSITVNSLITTGTNNNFVQFSNVGAVATANAQYQFAGSSNVTFRSAFGAGTTSSSVANSNVYANSLTAQSVFSVATGVTVPWAIQNEVASFGTITLTGSGSVTNTAMIRAENASTAGTNNYSIWFGTGLYHYDGLTASQAVYTDGNKNLISKDPNTSLITGTPTIVAGTGAGTGPTVTVTTNGKQLQVTVTTGTLPTGTNATIATVTLPNALTYTPLPVFSSASAATALLSGASMIFMTSTGTANVTITSGTTALTAATTYVWNITL